MRLEATTSSRKVQVLGFVLCALLVVFCASAQAQQPTKVPRLYLSASSASEASVRTNAFRQGLRELGYIEGKSIIVEVRYAEGKFDRLPALANELVRLPAEIIVTAGPSVTRPAKEARRRVFPFVMTNDSDRWEAVLSPAWRGPAATSPAFPLARELSGKRVEILKELLPHLTRVAIFGASAIPENAQTTKETEQAAAVLSLQTHISTCRIRKISMLHSAPRTSDGPTQPWRSTVHRIFNDSFPPPR